MKKVFSNIIKSPYKWLAASVLLYLLSFFFSNQFSRQSNLRQEWKKLGDYLSRNEKDFEKLTSDISLLARLNTRSETKEEYEGVVNRDYGFFLVNKHPFGGTEMKFWSNQESTPPHHLYGEPDGEYFEKLDNGYYYCIKKSLFSGGGLDSVIAFGLIPVQYNYFVETGYLPSEFVHNKKAGKRISISKDATSFSIKNKKGNPLFYLAEKNSSVSNDQHAAAFWLRLVSVLFLLIFIHLMAERTANIQGTIQGIGILIVGLVLIRLFSYYTSFPISLRQFDLFDPAVYGTNPILKSLGDLLINAILFCWITVFAWSKLRKTNKDWQLKFHNRQSGIWGFFPLIFIVAFTFIMAKTIYSLAADSNISFDVINFFSLTRFSIFGFAVLSVLVIGYYFFIRIMLLLISAFFVVKKYIIYLTIAISGLSWLTFNIDNPLVSFYILVLVWLVLYILLQMAGKIFFNNSRLTMSGNLFWIFLFSVSITAIIITANREKEWELRKKLADNISILSDPYNERQLSISFTYIDDDFLANNFLRFTNEETTHVLRDSLLREGGYLNKYDSRIYVFDAGGKALFNEEGESLNTLNTIISVQSKPTNTPHLFFYETSFDKFTFIFKREARDEAGQLLGTLFILSNPEQRKSDALYPELFRRANQNNPEESPVYSFAVYKKGILLTGPSNKYPFATSLIPGDLPVSKYEKRVTSSSDELWYKASNDKTVVIAKKRDSVIEAITLFSYIFCSFLFLVAFFSLVSLLLRVGVDYKEIARLLQWNIRTQIHSTIIFISIISFLIIGIATISFFIKRYEQNNTEKLNRTMQVMVNEMEKKLVEQKVFDDQLAIYDSVSNQDVQNLVNEVAEIHHVDVNVYDTIGNLQVTSQPLIYREGILSKKIHPLAFYFINRQRHVQYVQQEKLAMLSYLSIYAPIRDNEGHAYAYINIPYFLSQRELKQEISNFLVTIINLNAFIFLIAGVIALFITNRVTRSFSLISEKMKKINLGKANEEIMWERDDEIGELVKEYNKMVNKLETSAAALARSEREGAWREMARQVAHEIKNPLTPMKLSIQYLQKSIDNNNGNVKELTASVAKTLVEQIDHLSKIAFDFSQFANIGNTYPETFDLKEVLNSLGDLYKMNEKAEIVMNMPPDNIVIYTDKTQMNRLFTNLLQNALESCSEKIKCRIEVEAVKEDNKVIVSVNDNGEGIPLEMQSRIFAPNFTTKSSGTGLGLAMCKGIVEQAKGKIWFETQKGEGATFFVELPLVS